MIKVLGVGNALVDMLIEINNDKTLDMLNLPKGSMQLVDKDTSEMILKACEHFPISKVSGGSAANTIHGLSCLGANTGFIGKIGDDSIGEFYKSDMEQNNIDTILLKSQLGSGIATALISPDSERTFATHLGAASQLNENDLSSDLFKGYTHFYVEGYLVQNEALLTKALKLAKEQKLIIALDLASYNIVEDNLDFLKSVCEQYVDIIFANEEEAKAFTGGLENKEAASKIGEICNIAVLKLGKNGSLVYHNEKFTEIGIFEANSIDTTGAGDLYAAGFLYGLTNLQSLDKCGEIGALLSSKVIEQVGPKISEEAWKEIKHKLEEIMK